MEVTILGRGKSLEKLEDFKTAISSTVRSIANSPKIEVAFGAQVAKTEKDLIKLPDIFLN